MEVIHSEIKGAEDGQRRPELHPEDLMVSSYLKDRSEIYRDLVKVQDDASYFEPFSAFVPVC